MSRGNCVDVASRSCDTPPTIWKSKSTFLVEPRSLNQVPNSNFPVSIVDAFRQDYSLGQTESIEEVRISSRSLYLFFFGPGHRDHCLMTIVPGQFPPLAHHFDGESDFCRARSQTKIV